MSMLLRSLPTIIGGLALQAKEPPAERAAASMPGSDREANQRSTSSVPLSDPWTTAAAIPTTMNLTSRSTSPAKKATSASLKNVFATEPPHKPLGGRQRQVVQRMLDVADVEAALVGQPFGQAPSF